MVRFDVADFIERLAVFFDAVFFDGFFFDAVFFDAVFFAVCFFVAMAGFPIVSVVRADD